MSSSRKPFVSYEQLEQNLCVKKQVKQEVNMKRGSWSPNKYVILLILFEINITTNCIIFIITITSNIWNTIIITCYKVILKSITIILNTIITGTMTISSQNKPDNEMYQIKASFFILRFKGPFNWFKKEPSGDRVSPRKPRRTSISEPNLRDRAPSATRNGLRLGVLCSADTAQHYPLHP